MLFRRVLYYLSCSLASLFCGSLLFPLALPLVVTILVVLVIVTLNDWTPTITYSFQNPEYQVALLQLINSTDIIPSFLTLPIKYP